MKVVKVIGLAALTAIMVAHAQAAGIDDPARQPYYSAFQGKTVAFVPIAMGFDLTEGWAAGIKSALDPLGELIRSVFPPRKGSVWSGNAVQLSVANSEPRGCTPIM
jgi:hypothetical protein